VRCGGDYDRWDLEVRGGAFAVARVRLGVEEHGSGRQVLRFHSWALPSRGAAGAAIAFGTFAAAAAADGVAATAVPLGAMAAGLVLACLRDCANATGTLRRAIAVQARETGDDLLLDKADRIATAGQGATPAISVNHAARGLAANGARPGEDARRPAPEAARFARSPRTLDTAREARR
jgi:hypothetical protein